jgi:DNA repair protein RecN (Recombination protein N)
MLKNILIQNYALIDHLELEFEKGLNIVTGETGAGKSILLGALSLILGNRADTSALLDATKKCIVEGRFDADEKNLKDFFKTHELDFEKQVLIRREISSEGKSRSFINDTPVTLSQLKELGLLLVDIHSQHETLLLNKSNFQLSVVDAFAQHEKLLTEYKNHFFQFQSLNDELNDLVEEEKKSKADLDYFQFLFNELDEANLTDGEQEKLEEELQTLTHSEEIKSALTAALSTLSSNDNNLLNQLIQLTNSIQSITKYNSKLEEVAGRIKSVNIELKDLSNEIEAIGDEVNFDPQRVEIINERLNVLYKLQQKHRVSTIDGLLKLKNDFENKLQNISSLEEKINQLQKRLTDLKKNLVTLAHRISGNRNKAIPVIEKEIKKLLSEVSLPNAILKIENPVLTDDHLTQNGIDQIRFLFSANKGVAYSDISKVASGGELSRLMLCIKSSVAKLIELPTIIFDEIDTGISGETAVNVGRVLKNMATQHQLIAITHLPQIAGRGEAHYFVYKEVTNTKTFSKVRKLNADERIVEIAKMLSGEKPSAVAIENAKELLKN